MAISCTSEFTKLEIRSAGLLYTTTRDDWPADWCFPLDFSQRVKFWNTLLFKADC